MLHITKIHLISVLNETHVEDKLLHRIEKNT